MTLMRKRPTLGLLSLVTTALLAAAACSEPAAPPPKTPDAAPARRPPPKPKSEPTGPRPTGGSSDGVTCEEARERHVEEIAIGKKGGADLSAKDFDAILADGKYLAACDVTTATKVSVCVAVQNGAAVGVTIAMSPSSEDLEKCVAKEVRALAFPSHPRLDGVRTEF